MESLNVYKITIKCDLYNEEVEPSLDCKDCPHFEGRERLHDKHPLFYCNYDIELEETT